MKKIILMLLIIAPFSIQAQNPEKSGMTFLKVGYGARNIALGDLGFVVADGATGAFYNPALLETNSYQASFTHSSYLQDVSSDIFSATFTLFNLPFFVGVNTTSIKDIEIRTQPGEKEGTFNANYFSGNLSTAICITEELKVGLTGKYLFENLYSDEAAGLGIDLGVSYTGLFENLHLAAAVNNIGSMKELRNEETKLPTSAAIGASYDLNFTESSFGFVFAAGYKRYFSAESNHIQSGIEVNYDKLISARLGYISGYETKDLSYGLGICWGSFEFDYALVPNDFGLGNSGYLTIIYTF